MFFEHLVFKVMFNKNLRKADHDRSFSKSPRGGGFRSERTRSGSRDGASSQRSSGTSQSSSYSGGFRRSGPVSRGGRPGGFRGRGGGGRGGGRSERIDFSRFVNKAIITEEVEHFKPEHSFADFKIEAELKKAIIAKGYETPTPIQDRAIPHILSGTDIVGIANTGTGKTAAFLIPLIHKVRLNPREQVMIIAPTRELAIQIESELKGFVSGIKTGAKVYSVCCVGGMPIGRQIKDLQYQYNFVIGTPGRLKDLIDRKMITLSEFSTVVLDEADQMLDMGFINDMRSIMGGMPKARHTLFFSATLSPDIEKIIKDFLKDPVRISVKTQDTAKNVDQDVVRITRDKQKIDVLHDLLKQEGFLKVLVFARTKHGAEEISRELARKGFKAESIHGNKNHGQRQRALKSFKDSHVQVLVATDVAARGLDIADVSHVINYDIPATYDDYVHRIGRTGRGNKKGKALTFIN